jgi:hypothetical protein
MNDLTGSKVLTGERILFNAFSVSFIVVTPGGRVGSPEGRTPNIDAKFLTTFFLLISPISSFQPSSHSSLRLNLLLFLLPARSHKRNENLIVLLSPTAGRSVCSLGQSPKKNLSVKFPRGAQRFARGGGQSPPGECLNETLNAFKDMYFTCHMKFEKLST